MNVSLIQMPGVRIEMQKAEAKLLSRAMRALLENTAGPVDVFDQYGKVEQLQGILERLIDS